MRTLGEQNGRVGPHRWGAGPLARAIAADVSCERHAQSVHDDGSRRLRDTIGQPRRRTTMVGRHQQ